MAKNIAKGGRDNYPTPQIYADWAIERALGLMPGTPDILLGLEPGCGATAPFLSALVDQAPVVGLGVGVEMEAWVPKLSAVTGENLKIRMGTDFLDPKQDRLWMPEPDTKFFLIATNPPFSVCEEFMDKSLRLLHPMGVMVFLLRMAIMGSKKRLDFWKKHMPLEIAHFVRRISFDGTSTDYAEYACFFWAGEDLEDMWHRHRGSCSTAFYLVNNVMESVNEKGCLEEIGAPPFV
jgi:hypothetical protein